MDILFEDKDILVCIKPVGILSQSDIGGRDNMVSRLTEHCKASVYPLHRLDKDTGGVMVYAKSRTAAAALSRDIAEHRFCKKYFAVLHGVPENCEDVFCDLLFKDSRKNKVYTVSRMRKGVKPAELSYKLLDTAAYKNENVSLVCVTLKTGRTHQIRVQFASRSLPLIGDNKYGARDGLSELGLWSYSIAFTHPSSKEKLNFSFYPQNIISEIFPQKNTAS